MAKKNNKKNNKTTGTTNAPKVARDRPQEKKKGALERKKGEPRPHGEGLSKTARRARKRRLRAEAIAKAPSNSGFVVKKDEEPGINMTNMPQAVNQSSSFPPWANGGARGATPYSPFSIVAPYNPLSSADTRPATEIQPLFPMSESSKLQPFGSIAAVLGHGSPSWALNKVSREVQLGSSATRNASAESSLFGQIEKTEPVPLVPIFPSNKSRSLGPGLLSNKTEFGQPPKPVPGFTHPIWVRADPEEIANGQPKPEKSLEELYNEYPGKRLCGIEPDVLNIAAQAFQQVAYEAANNWLKLACPNTRWKDKDVCVEPLYDYSAPELDHTIMSRAMNLQRLKNTVTTLIRNSRAAHRSVQIMTPLTLIHMIDHDISICHLVNDSKRKLLLEKAKEKMEWLPVGLDCKKLDIHRRAATKLEQQYSRARNDLTTTRKNATAQNSEVEILDQALVEFQEYRLEFVVEMFQTIKQVLVATA